MIAAERQKQIMKHGYTPKSDQFYDAGDLLLFAEYMMKRDDDAEADNIHEYLSASKEDLGAGINGRYLYNLREKPILERLVIAGALIAAEIDRELYDN